MNDLVYPHERTLGNILLVLGVIVWLVLIVGSFGGALIGLALGFMVYLFIHSKLIAHIKGNGVELSEAQFPDLYAQFTDCCDRLQMPTRPQAFVLYGHGALNAFATRFLGTQYVILLSNVVDAMDKHVDGVRFYIGHELGHLRMKHLRGQMLRWPVLWLPLLGAAYSRARETTCDRHGLACSSSPEAAAQALAALSAGVERWQRIDVASYRTQAQHASGFWMSFHELTEGYPWLTKRAARVMNTDAKMPGRNAFAYLLALFVPYAGRLGAGFGFLMVIYIIGIMAAVAIPAYHGYIVKAKLGVDFAQSQNVRDALGNYYQSNKRVPESLDALGINPQLPDGSTLALDPRNMRLTVGTREGALIFIPSSTDDGRVVWQCANGKGLKQTELPPACHTGGNQ